MSSSDSMSGRSTPTPSTWQSMLHREGIRSVLFLGRLLSVDLIKPASVSVRTYVHPSTKRFSDSSEICSARRLYHVLTALHISLGGEGNVLYPVVSSLYCSAY